MTSNEGSKFKTAKKLLGQESSTVEISFEVLHTQSHSRSPYTLSLSALYSVSHFLVNGDTVGLRLHFFI